MAYTTEICLTVLEDGILRSGCQQGWFPESKDQKLWEGSTIKFNKYLDLWFKCVYSLNILSSYVILGRLLSFSESLLSHCKLPPKNILRIK